jgi:hypothetical protein
MGILVPNLPVAAVDDELAMLMARDLPSSIDDCEHRGGILLIREG